MPIPDPFAPTVPMFVKVSKGRVKCQNGKPIPKVKPGTVAELILWASEIETEEDRIRLTSERTVAFLPAGTTLWAKVKEDSV
jgi:hypothetical protein